MNDNYICGIECLREQIRSKRRKLQGQAGTDKGNRRRHQSLMEEIKELKRRGKEFDQNSAFLKETVGRLVSYGGEVFQDPFVREQRLLNEQRRELETEVSGLNLIGAQALSVLQGQLKRYDYGEEVLSAYLETGIRPERTDKNWKALFTRDDILGYACRIAFPSQEENGAFCQAFLSSPEYGNIPAGRGKRCVDGILIDHLCRNHTGESGDWLELPLVWDADCRTGDKFLYAYELQEAGLLTSGLLALGGSPERENLLGYFEEVAAGRVSPKADKIMRPLAESGLRGLLNPEGEEFFANVEALRQWEHSEWFWEYRQIAEEELDRERTRSRVETLLRMTLGEMLQRRRFGKVADEKVFAEQFVRKYFEGELEDYLEAPHGEWKATADEVRRAIRKSPSVYAQRENWFQQLQDGDPEAVFFYFESGMYAEEQDLERQALVMETMKKRLTEDTDHCAEVLERLGRWKEREDFGPYEKLVLSLSKEPAVQTALQQSIETLYRNYLMKITPPVANPVLLATQMAEVYRRRYLNLNVGKWDVKSSALKCIETKEMQKLIEDGRKQKNLEAENDKRMKRLRSGQDLSKKDILWYFREVLPERAADAELIRNIGPKLKKLLEAELPGTTETLRLLKEKRYSPNFKPFEAAVSQALAGKKDEIRGVCVSQAEAVFFEKTDSITTDRKSFSNLLAEKYLEKYFEFILGEWDWYSVAARERALKWLDTDTVRQLISREEKQRQEADKKEQESGESRKAGEGRFLFGLWDLLLVLAGGTGIVPAFVCVLFMEIRVVWKHKEGFLKHLSALGLRIVLLLAVSAVYQATGGYSLLSHQQSFLGTGSMAEALWRGGYICCLTAAAGYLPAVWISGRRPRKNRLSES